MSWWRKPGGFRASLLIGLALSLAQKGVEAAVDAFRRREREETNKALESKIDKASQDLDNKMKALHEDFKKLQEIRAELEKNQEEEIAMELKSKLKKNVRELSRRIETLQEDVKKWREIIKDELRLLRVDLEKNTGNRMEQIAQALKSMLKNHHRQLSQRTHTLQEDVQECLEATKDELRLRRA